METGRQRLSQICHGTDPIFFYFDIHFHSICLNALAKISRIGLNRNGESGHHCFIPYLSGNAFSFFPFSMMLVIGLSCVACVILRYFPSISNLWKVLWFPFVCYIFFQPFTFSLYVALYEKWNSFRHCIMDYHHYYYYYYITLAHPRLWARKFIWSINVQG